ncbi:MAG: hypothetical protein QOD60_203, partial [Solirubrobacterales bacterium]|nr:hypothetical protein [Solirubrobacterales bacterium]
MRVIAIGGVGGRGGNGSVLGGFGALAVADLAVKPGAILYVEVGGGGGNGGPESVTANAGSPGFNGGAAGGLS